MNPYSPPAARVADTAVASEGPSGRAVLFGVLSAIGSTLSSVVAGVTFYYMAFGVPGESEEHLAISLLGTRWIMPAGIAAVALSALVGAYVCARTARQSEYRLGVFVTLIYGLLISLRVGGPTVGSTLLLLLLTLPPAMAGARIGVVKNLADARAA